MSTEPENSPPSPETTRMSEGLSVTALYTAHAWAWAKFPYAELFSSDQTKGVFNVTNFALGVMRLFRWGLPRLPEGLAQRHTLIDQLSGETLPEVVIELAAGLSTRGLRLIADPSLPLKRFIEVDLPHVISFKRQHYAGENAPHYPKNLLSKEIDLKELNQEQLVEWLDEDQDRSHQKPSPVVIAEGILMYFNEEEVETLLSVISSLLQSRGGRLIFDWVPTVEQPKPGILGRLLGSMMRFFTRGGDFHRDERTRADMLRLLEKLNATACEAIDTSSIAHTRALPFPTAHTQQVIFVADWTRP